MNFAFKRNKTRTMTAARGDGWVLKPDRALSTQCDLEGGRQLLQEWRPDLPYFLHLFRSRHGQGRLNFAFKLMNFVFIMMICTGKVGYLYMDKPVPVMADDFNLTDADDAVLYNWYSGEVSKLGASNTVSAGYEWLRGSHLRAGVAGRRWLGVHRRGRQVRSGVETPVPQGGRGGRQADGLRRGRGGLGSEGVRSPGAQAGLSERQVQRGHDQDSQLPGRQLGHLYSLGQYAAMHNETQRSGPAVLLLVMKVLLPKHSAKYTLCMLMV